MKNILLILMLTSCGNYSRNSITRKFYIMGGEEVEEKELEINEKSYNLVYNVELGERNIYKIFKEDQKNVEEMVDNCIKEIIDIIKDKEEYNEEILKKFCNELHDKGLKTEYKDKSTGHIKVFVEEKIIFIYDSLKSAMFNNLSVDEINFKFAEAIDEISFSNKEIKQFVLNIFKEGNNSFSTYQAIKGYFPSNMDIKIKEEIFEAIKIKDYSKLKTSLKKNRNQLREIIIFGLSELENEKFIAFNDKIVSKMLTLYPNGQTIETINGSQIGDIELSAEKKICYKQVSLILRKYKKNKL